MLSFDDMQVFIEVYKCRSYSMAAAKLRLSQPTVSRKIKQLEEVFQRPLFFVKSNQLQITNFAEELYNCSYGHIHELLLSVERLRADVDTKDFVGTVRIQLPLVISLYKFSTLLPHFVKSNPNLDVEIIYSNTEYDIIKNQIDIGVLNRMPLVNELKFKNIFEEPSIRLYCTKKYAEKFGLPNTPKEIEKHLVLGYIDDGHNYRDTVTLTNNSTLEKVSLKMPHRIKTNHMLHNSKIMLSHEAIVFLLDKTVEEIKYYSEDEIVSVLPDWYLPSFKLYLFTNNYRNQKNIKLVSDFIMNCFSGDQIDP